jgi:methylmalonyl-CoA mutase N-terminal domain/subunit
MKNLRDYDESNHGNTSSVPGEFPFRSGIYPGMYRTKKWNIRQYSGYGNASDANKNFQKLIKSGNRGISIAFDLPTQMGLNPLNELAKFEVGKVGVSINSLDDMRKLFCGINLEEVEVSMTINATAGILLLMYHIIAEENELNSLKLRGTLQNDILKEFITRSTHVFPLEESLRFTNDVLEYCEKELPNWSPISISGYHFAEAGATASQEVAFAIANGIHYLENAELSGLNIQKIATKVSFFFAAKTNILEEIAKFRAARSVWAKTIKDRFIFDNPKAMQMRIHAQTAGSQLYPFGIENNLSRVTIQAMAAIFGGVQSLHTNSYDEALNLPTENASKLAINIQQILKDETDITLACDPFGGSFLIENITNQIEVEILNILNEIRLNGGVTKSIDLGYQRSLIEKNSYADAMASLENHKKIVGINSGAIIEEVPEFNLSSSGATSIFHSMPVGKIPMKTLNIDQNIFAELVYSAKNKTNVMYPIKNLLRAGASLSDICEILRKCWGQI